jgi:hypothetical protein
VDAVSVEVCLPTCDDDPEACGANASCFSLSSGDACLERCDPFDANSCSGPLVGCYFFNTDSCEGNCFSAGTLREGESCTGDNRCAPGLDCRAGVCRRLCRASLGDGDCRADEICDDVNSCNLGTCMTRCDPLAGADACANGDVCRRMRDCDYGCFPSENVAEGGACEFSSDCAPGNACVSNVCRTFCDPSSSTCTCDALSACPEIGVCEP